MSENTPSNSDPPAFRITGVKKIYRLDRTHSVRVLNGIDLTVKPGSWIALTGASGSGKTTLLHLLAALDRPDDGDIHCLGHNLCKMRSGKRCEFRRTSIGLVFQQYHLLPELSALENVVLPARIDTSAEQAMDRARSLLDRFGLSERLNHRPQELSGGEQQRVALARALINQPRIILADEPTGNLDETAGNAIMGFLAELCREEGKTLIMVTHDSSLAKEADRIYHLAEGRLMPHDHA
jgi:lipoprotein-releasing system ATP-binding protein